MLPWHGIIIGIAAGGVCYWACTKLKLWLGYDDSLDVFGVHGVGGITGVIATGVFATAALSIDPATLPGGSPGLIDGNPSQVVTQLIAVGATIAYAIVATFIIVKVVDVILGLRVNSEEEEMGLDKAVHGEVAYQP